MPNLSSPVGELRPRYRVVVIGSGYGGAIAAFRMARKLPPGETGSVCVLERGPERQAGDFPATFARAIGEVQVDARGGRVGRRTGLFDFRVNRDVSVLVGCGLGGTSLINAGVMLRPHDSVWADDWPKTLRDNPRQLDDDYTAVLRALSAEPVPDVVALQKVEQLFAAGRAAIPKAPDGIRPDIAVSFVTGDNRFGVHQRRCTLCGDCVTGCNHEAKNTVQMNYLPGAVNAGAVIFCGIEVRSVERGDGDEWLVHVRILDRAWQRFGRRELTLRAGAVFLGAGTLGSTEILLRSRARHALRFSTRLGDHFSSNGDAIAFGYNCRDTVDGIGYGRLLPVGPSVGPTIAGMLDERTDKGGLMIQEGAVPGALAGALRFAAPFIARATRRPADISFDFGFTHVWREVHSLIRGARHGALARTQTFLVMSRDNSGGRLRLAGDRVRVIWPLAGDQPVFARVAQRLAQVTEAMRGRYVINPFWARLFGRRLLTVHPLGGCAMADTADQGVVDDRGRVFDTRGGVYSNLYVCDGAIIPRALGANPALTIGALAERIARHAPLPDVRAADRAHSRTDHEIRGVEYAERPRGVFGRIGAFLRRVLGRASRPMEERRPARVDTTAAGLQYGERLRGWVELDGRRSRIELMLHISAESVEDLLTGPAHSARIVGTARTPAYGVTRWTVSHGTMNVLVKDPRKVDTQLIAYRLKLTPERGDRAVWIQGHKTINLETCSKGTWRAITGLPFVVFASDIEGPIPPDSPLFSARCQSVDDWSALDPTAWAALVAAHRSRRGSRVVGRGSVRNSVPDVLRFVSSMEVTHERRWSRRVRMLLRYGYYFADAVFQARVWPLQRTVRLNPFSRRPFELKSTPDRREFLDDKPVGSLPRYLLTAYPADSHGRQPVIVAPGFGMSADSFLVGPTPFVDYLVKGVKAEEKEKYQVWLLDYRASDRLDISLTQFSLDDLVEDFSDAVQRVHQETGKKVRIVGHCVASLTTFMMLLKGGPANDVVKSVVLSQSFAFIDYPFTNKVKAWIRLPQLLKILGFRPMLTTDFDVRSGRGSRILDWLLRLYPTGEHCSSGVCRRILLLYGEVLRHDQLDYETHDKLYDLFDRATLGVFEHVSCMVRKGHIVDVRGRNTYLVPKKAKQLTMPITLIHGQLNRLFRPPGAYRTHAWLIENGFRRDPAENRTRFVRREIPGYAHLDHFIGKNAARDVFPVIVEELKRMEGLP